MAKMWIFGFSPGVCPTEPSNLVFSFGCLVSNGRQALLGGIRLGGSATSTAISRLIMIILFFLMSYCQNEPHDATNNVVKIDIATSCDDLIIESIEQSSSSKGKQVVEANDYDEFVKLKNDNKKLKKDLEELKATKSIVLETIVHHDGLILENEKLKDENKKLKEEKNNDALKKTRSSSWRKSILRLD